MSLLKRCSRLWCSQYDVKPTSKIYVLLEKWFLIEGFNFVKHNGFCVSTFHAKFEVAIFDVLFNFFLCSLLLFWKWGVDFSFLIVSYLNNFGKKPPLKQQYYILLQWLIISPVTHLTQKMSIDFQTNILFCRKKVSALR